MNRKFLSALLMFSLFGLAQANAVEKKYSSIEGGTATDGTVSSDSSDVEPFKGDHPFAPRDVSFGVGINFFDSFGMHGKYGYRLLDNRKFIADFSNAVYLEGGAGVTFYGKVGDKTNVTGFDLLASLRWDFQYNSVFTLFGSAGFGYNIVSNSAAKEVRGGNLFPAVGAGAFYNIDKNLAARFDLSWQFLGIGITYKL